MAITNIKEIKKLKTARKERFVVVQVQEVNGVPKVDIRTYLDNAPGKEKPYTGFTKEGVGFTEAELTELMKALTTAKTELAKRNKAK